MELLLLLAAVVVFFVWVGTRGSDPEPFRPPEQAQPPDPELRVTVSYPDTSDLGLYDHLRFEWTPHYYARTSLEALQHQGEIWEGEQQKAPTYGKEGDGYWRYIGHDDRDREEWSEIGNIPPNGGEFKEFLIEFREIVEGGGSTVEKIQAAERLCEKSATHTDFADRIGTEFPYSWFASQLTVLPSVGQGTAQKLFDAGFINLDSVRAATDDELEAIHGVGPGTVSEIRKYFAEEPARGSRRRFQDRRQLPPGESPS